MSDVSVLDEPGYKFGKKRFDVAEYSKKLFGMYSGELVRANISFDPSLMNVILDRFGRDVHIFEEMEAG